MSLPSAIEHIADAEPNPSQARTTAAALGMICDAAKSQVPGLGYTVAYAVGNT
jgi:hypothetical protein